MNKRPKRRRNYGTRDINFGSIRRLSRASSCVVGKKTFINPSNEGKTGIVLLCPWPFDCIEKVLLELASVRIAHT